MIPNTRVIRSAWWTLCLATLGVGFASAAVTTLGYWHLGESDVMPIPGETVFSSVDASGGFDLSVMGAPVYSSAVAGGGGSSVSLQFSAGGQSLYCGTLVSGAASLQNVGGEAWFRLATDIKTNGVVFYSGDSSANGHGLLLRGFGDDPDTLSVLIGGAWFVNLCTVVPGTWYYAAYVFNGSELVTYIATEGEATLSRTSYGEVVPLVIGPSESFQIGSSVGDPFQTLIGWVDEVRVFSFAPGEFSQGDLLFGAVPEPGSSAALAGVVALGCVLNRRRR